MSIYSEKNPPDGYYVYAYLRDNGSPYYIGKGIGPRAWRKGRHEISKPKSPSNIIIVEQKLTAIGAFAIERRLISWYGRIDKETGILRNQTDGGDGGPGRKPGKTGRKLTDEQKARISQACKGRKISEETRDKISKKLTGFKQSPKHIENRLISRSK